MSRTNEQLSKRPELVIHIHTLLGDFLAGNMCIFHVIRSNSALLVFPADISCLKHEAHKACVASGHATALIQGKSFLWSHHSSAGFYEHSCSKDGWSSSQNENIVPKKF